MSTVVPRPLTSKGFAPFGKVFAFDPHEARPVNDGNALRGDLPFDFTVFEGQPRLSLFRVQAQTLPLRVKAFERHPHSSQMFYPISARAFLVVMAPRASDGSPDVAKAEAFIGQAGQGVLYRPAVWHAPMVALDADGDFLMLIGEQDTSEDCHVEPLSVPLRISPEPL